MLIHTIHTERENSATISTIRRIIANDERKSEKKTHRACLLISLKDTASSYLMRIFQLFLTHRSISINCNRSYAFNKFCFKQCGKNRNGLFCIESNWISFLVRIMKFKVFRASISWWVGIGFKNETYNQRNIYSQTWVFLVLCNNFMLKIQKQIHRMVRNIPKKKKKI